MEEQRPEDEVGEVCLRKLTTARMPGFMRTRGPIVLGDPSLTGMSRIMGLYLASDACDRLIGLEL